MFVRAAMAALGIVVTLLAPNRSELLVVVHDTVTSPVFSTEDVFVAHPAVQNDDAIFTLCSQKTNLLLREFDVFEKISVFSFFPITLFQMTASASTG